MAPTLLFGGVARAFACVATALSLAAPTLLHAQTMVPDTTFHPQFRARANVRVFPQHDGGLAVTGATYLGDAPAPEVFRMSADGTVIDDDGPRVAITTPRSDIVCADGRRVTATIEIVDAGFEQTWYKAVVTTRDASGATLGTVVLDEWDFMENLDRRRSAEESFRVVELEDGRVMVGGGPELVRINTDGTKDAGFTADVPIDAGVFRDLLAMPDGSIIVALGGTLVPDNYGFHVEGPAVLHRLAADGSRDTTYSATLDEPALHVALPDGGLIAGTTGLQRLRPDGTTDATFGPLPSALARILSVRRLSDGTLLVAGGYANDIPAVFRLSADGALIHDLITFFPDSQALVLDGVDPTGNAWVRHGAGGGIYRDMNEGVVAFVADQAIARIPLTGVQGALEPEAVTITPTPWIDGTVSRMMADDDGRLVISGNFATIDGVAHAGLARLLNDGRVDHDFSPEFNAWVSAVHGDGRVLVRTDDGFRRLLSDGSVDSSLPLECDLNADSQRQVHAVTSDGGYLVVRRSSVSGENAPPTRLQAFSSAGALLLDIPNPGGVTGIETLASRADGAIVVLGSRPVLWPNYHVFAVLPDGSLDPDYHLALPAGVGIERAVLMPDGGALISADLPGDLTAQRELLRFAPDGSLDRTFATLPDERLMLADLHPYPQADGTVLFPMTGNPGEDKKVLVRWLRDGTQAAGFRASVPGDGASSAVLTSNGDLYALPYSIYGASLPPLERWTMDRGSDWVQRLPDSQMIRAGEILVLDASSGSASPHTYQWLRDDVEIPGATSARYLVDRASLSDAGTYRCRIHFNTFDYLTPTAVVAITPNTTKLVNFSARSRVEAGTVQIGGIVVDDAAGQPALLRAIGNALPFDIGVPLLPDPVLTLFEDDDAITSDRGGVWDSAVEDLGRTLGAFAPRWPWPDDPLALPTNSALIVDLPPGVYTAHTTSGDGTAGVSLFEYYDADPSGSRRGVRNLSVRATTGPGADVLIPGFVVRGNGTLRILARAVGPSLAALGVGNAVEDPRMILRAHDLSGSVDAVNDDWAGDPAIAAAAATVGAFELDASSKDAALLITLPAGAYTIQVPTAGEQSGEVLVELYVVDP